MIASLNTTRVQLTLPGYVRRAQLPRVAKWIGPRPQRTHARAAVMLADGIWIIPELPRFPHSPEWMSLGLCTKLPVGSVDAMFFGAERRSAPGPLIAAANTARQLCARCPVNTTCLTHALITGERYGVWGGTSGRQRSKLRRRLDSGSRVDELVAECLPKKAVGA